MLAPVYTERRARKDMNLPQSSDQTIFPFLKLPRELRDPVYRHLIRDGHVAILRVSKLVKKEASEFLSTHATLRIKLGFPHRIICSELFSALVTPTAQHVNLCLMVHHAINLEIISGLEYHPTEPLSEDWSRESLDCFPELESGGSEGGSEGESEEAF